MQEKISMDAAHDFEAKMPLSRKIPLGLQHVFAMFVGNLTPLLIIMGACGIAGGEFADLQVSVLQNAMFVAGVVTLVQLFSIGPIGGKVPIIMGTSSGFIGVFNSVAATMGGGVIAYGAIMGLRGRAHNRAIRNHTAAHGSRNAVEHADKTRACTHDDRHLAADRADGKQLHQRSTPATNIAFCRTLTCRSANSPPAMPHAPMMMSSGVRLPTNIAKTCSVPSGILRDKGIFASKSCAASIEIFSCIPTLLCVVL